MLRRWIKRIDAGFALLATLAALPLSWPSPLFAYSLTVRNLAVASITETTLDLAPPNSSGCHHHLQDVFLMSVENFVATRAV